MAKKGNFVHPGAGSPARENNLAIESLMQATLPPPSKRTFFAVSSFCSLRPKKHLVC